jgi:hypothetical protein
MRNNIPIIKTLYVGRAESDRAIFENLKVEPESINHSIEGKRKIRYPDPEITIQQEIF